MKLDEFANLAAPEGFRAFTLYTKAGLKMT